MSTFVSTRRFSLGFMGEEWKECFIVYSPLSIDELRHAVDDTQGGSVINEKEAINMAYKIAKDHFLNGVGYGGEAGLVKITPENFGDLPAPIIMQSTAFLIGEQERKNA